MKNTFRGYYRPTEAEFGELWRTALFVPDANVLLSLYRYSTATTLELIEVLRNISDRLWLPHQAGLEYHRNRISAIEKQAASYDQIDDLLTKLENQLDNALRAFSRHPLIDVTILRQRTSRQFARIRKDILTRKQQHPDLIHEDYIRDALTAIFDGKVGPSYSKERLDEILKQGKARFDAKVPPGYEDQSKADARQFGDLILWFQLIDKARETNCPIILVTDDSKADWWLIGTSGETISPRPELIEEMYREAKVPFYIYKTDPFLEHARKYIKSRVKREAINEVRAVRQQDERLSVTMDSESMRQAIDSIAGQTSPLHEQISKLAETYAKIGASPWSDQISKLAETYAKIGASPWSDQISKLAETYATIRTPRLDEQVGKILAENLLAIRTPRLDEQVGKMLSEVLASQKSLADKQTLEGIDAPKEEESTGSERDSAHHDAKDAQSSNCDATGIGDSAGHGEETEDTE